MEFISVPFFIFCVITLFLYYTFPQYQKRILLLSSFVFYITLSPTLHLFYIFFCFTVFFILKYILSIKKIRQKKIYLIPFLFFALIPLFIHKYGSFIPTVQPFFSFTGISFISFMLIGFIIDSLYTEKKSVQTIGDSILFLFYFPRVISGPIDRKNNFNKHLIYKWGF